MPIQDQAIMQPPIVLCLSGSDPSGGAGLQADLRTLASLGVYGTAIPTAVTIQDSQRVYRVLPQPAEAISEQLTRLLDDVEVAVIKLGMLATPAIIAALRAPLLKFGGAIVLDPLIFSGAGQRLLECSAPEELDWLLRRAFVITANIQEAEFFSGIQVTEPNSMHEAAERIAEHWQTENVIIKGGHLAGDPINILRHQGEFTSSRRPRLPLARTHGTGCCFASSIAAFLAKGDGIETSFLKATDLLYRALQAGFDIGEGVRIPNPLRGIERLTSHDDGKSKSEISIAKGRSGKLAHVGSDLALT